MIRKIFYALCAITPIFLPAHASDLITGQARVVDGDTLAIGENRIRLYGIDAPEKGQDCLDAGGRRYLCGPVASRALNGKIAGRHVSCEKRDVDRYSRIIAICRNHAGDDIGKWMVKTGNAVAYRRYSKLYMDDEIEASTAKRGLWAGSFVSPSEWRTGKR